MGECDGMRAGLERDRSKGPCPVCWLKSGAAPSAAMELILMERGTSLIKTPVPLGSVCLAAKAYMKGTAGGREGGRKGEQGGGREATEGWMNGEEGTSSASSQTGQPCLFCSQQKCLCKLWQQAALAMLRHCCCCCCHHCVLASVCPSRNADSEGRTPSEFNDPCDFSTLNMSSEAGQPVSPSFRLPRSPHRHHCHR